MRSSEKNHVGTKLYLDIDPTNLYVITEDDGNAFKAVSEKTGQVQSVAWSYFGVDGWHFDELRFTRDLPVDKKQVGGTHYVDMEIQPWEVIKRNKMGFFDGNALKYLMRYRGKNGVEDLKKSIHYIEELIKDLESNELV